VRAWFWDTAWHKKQATQRKQQSCSGAQPASSCKGAVLHSPHHLPKGSVLHSPCQLALEPSPRPLSSARTCSRREGTTVVSLVGGHKTNQSKAKQGTTLQSKAKQSKVKPSVAKQSKAKYYFSRMGSILAHRSHLSSFAERSYVWRGTAYRAVPAELHSLLRLQMVLLGPHPFQVVPNSLLTKAIGEHGMESATRE